MMTLDLYEHLQHTWHTLCKRHDVTGDLPSIGTLFADTDPSCPVEAARAVLVTMLSEIMEDVPRFSPWYKRPASAYGIVPVRQLGAAHPHWMLTPAALQGYEPLLDKLAFAIEQNVGIILATRFVDDLDRVPEPADPCRMAACQCSPPRTILVHAVVIARAEIVCDACQQPFVLAGDAPHLNL